ncbi:MAG: 4'-phosphopantetheinyl transferase superfamily protein [Lachnospiraceae bacterium]|nr:4'-phosphopantetheinyl transferase superfamily protein [Lachnospiraceae bacterium]
MVRVYVTDLTGWLEQGLPAEAAAVLSAERREKWERQRGSTGALQSAAAELLLRCALKEQGIRTPAEWTWEYEAGGRPSLRGLAGVCFNLSHSGHYAVCALAEGPAGVDVQMVADRERAGVVRRFCREEMTEVEESEKPEEAFCRLWTAKEAYLKMRGTGLRRPLNSFLVTPEGRVEDPPGTESGCFVTWLPVWPERRDAALAVCACERCGEAVVFRETEELLKSL